MRRKIVITIDGTAASGKSTTAREVAERLGYIYLDTGAMYRALTLKVLREKMEPDDRKGLSELVDDTEVNIDRKNRVWLDGEDVTSQIRDPEVNKLVSIVSAIPVVRHRLVAIQREIGKDGGLVCEGRDTGTVVFPEAQLKIYMHAELSERAKRRRDEFSERDIHLNEEEVMQDLSSRDKIDSTRSHSPLRIPKDAIVIDTTHLSREEEIEKVVQEARKLGL